MLILLFCNLVFPVYVRLSKAFFFSAAVGMENGRIANSQLTASSEYVSGKLPPWKGRLNNPSSAWAAINTNAGHWIQIKFDVAHTIFAIATQGAPTIDQWTKTYTVKYSNDGINFADYNNSQVFVGNTDRNTVVRNELNLKAKFVRVYPKTWEWYIVMRLEVYGCAL